MATKNSKKRLFEDEDDEIEDERDEKNSFQINDEYAKRFEHNKKREEKQKLEEKYGKAAENLAGSDEDSEDSEEDVTEDEDGYLLTEDVDSRMAAALQAIKNKDPRIYDSQTKFFDPSEIDKVAEEATTAKTSDSKQQKPLFLRDYHRERYLRGDIGADDEDGDMDSTVPKTYQQEQDDAKRDLLAAMDNDGEHGNSDDDDDADNFLKPKKKAAEESNADESGIHPSRADIVPSVKDKKKKNKKKKLSESDVANADKNPELFLSNFMAARAWVPDDDDEGPGWQAFESDDDEEEHDRAEEFETAYNMRFEDPSKSNEVLKSYSRNVVAERSVRREQKTGRQRQRDQEKARQEEEKRERHEERARLRKLRIEEAQEKLGQIKQAAGIRGKVLAEDDWTALLDDAWDTEKWEIKMKEQFGDLYYGEEDAEIEEEKEGGEEESGDENTKGKSKSRYKPKKPKWDDDIDIKDLIPDFDDSNPKITLSDDEADGPVDEDADGKDNIDEEQPAKRHKTAKDHKQDRADKKRQARLERARIEAIVDRQLELDAPTALAGSRSAGTSASASASASTHNASTSGFRYRETSPQSFGLTSRDILLAPSDSALNEFAGLKKLATFRDEERKRKDRKKLGKKARLRQWRKETFGKDYELTGPTYGFERMVEEEEVVSTKNNKITKSQKSTSAHEADDGGEKSGKKRKRSGRKGKAKEQEA